MESRSFSVLGNRTVSIELRLYQSTVGCIFYVKLKISGVRHSSGMDRISHVNRTTTWENTVHVTETIIVHIYQHGMNIICIVPV